MKKILLMAMAATMFAACTQNEEFENAGSNKEMKFNTAVMGTTRATAITTASFNEFKLYAFYNNAVIIDGLSFTKGSESSWATDPAKTFYWPGAADVDFWGYSVTTMGDITNYNATAKTFDYTVKTTADAQEDLLVADAVKLNASSSNGTATIPFTHALTRMSFKMKGDANATSELTFTVSEIAISAKSTGTYNLATPGWTATTGDVSYSITTPSAFKGEAAAVSLTGDFMMIPQTGATITVKYTVGTSYYTSDAITKSFTFDEWKKGKNVVYTIELPSDALKKMVVVGDLDDTGWTTGTAGTTTPKPETPK